MPTVILSEFLVVILSAAKDLLFTDRVAKSRFFVAALLRMTNV
jgi:hypothetical protein